MNTKYKISCDIPWHYFLRISEINRLWCLIMMMMMMVLIIANAYSFLCAKL